MTPSPVAAARLLRTTTRPSLRWRGGGAAGLSEYRPPTSSSPMHAIFSPNDMLVGRAARRRPISGGGGGGGGAVVRRAHSSSSSAAETREGEEEEEGETNDDATTATYDVFIVGGGAVGSALAKRLVERVGGGGSLSIGLLDPRLPPPLSSYDDATAATDGGGAVPMARAYALSPSSLVTLGNDGSGGPGDVVGRLGGIGRVARYDKMQVWESDGPGAIRFSADDLSNHPDPRVSSQGILGAVVEDGPLVSSLWDFLREHGGSVPPEQHDGGGSARLDLIAPARVTKIDAPPADGRRVAGGVGGGGGDDELVRLTYKTGAPPNGVGDGGTDSGGGGGAKTATTERTVRARLLVAADGANSFVRKTLSMPTMGFGYGRKSVICAVRLDDSPGSGMHGTAYQRFFPPGPVALLPLWDGAEGGNSKYANVVWSTTPERAEELTSMPPDAFVQELNDALRVGPTNPPPLTSDEFASGLHPWIRNALYGADMLARSVGEGLAMMSWYDDPFRLPPKASELIGRRFAFDLSLKQATRYVHPRVALMGDAAHTVHPMAGQGLNLGFGDVECLVGCVADAAGGGMDVGGGYFLERYETERRAAVGVVMGGIHVLHGAFGTEVAPAVVMRGIGVNAVNSVGPLRRRLAEVAAGGGGGGVSSNGGRQGHKF